MTRPRRACRHGYGVHCICEKYVSQICAYNKMTGMPDLQKIALIHLHPHVPADVTSMGSDNLGSWTLQRHKVSQPNRLTSIGLTCSSGKADKADISFQIGDCTPAACLGLPKHP